MDTPEDLSDWTGGIDGLVAAANRILASPDRTPSEAERRELECTVRLVRLYIGKKILSPAERVGKESLYRGHHVLELAAARILVREGVPLAMIAEQFRWDRRLPAQILGYPAIGTHAGPKGSQALEAWAALESCGAYPEASDCRSEAPAALEPSSPERAGQDREEATREGRAKEVPGREGGRVQHRGAMAIASAISATARHQTWLRTLHALGTDPQAFKPRMRLELPLTDWCSLSIDYARFVNLSEEEAQCIGDAVASLLSDPKFRARIADEQD